MGKGGARRDICVVAERGGAGGGGGVVHCVYVLQLRLRASTGAADSIRTTHVE